MRWILPILICTAAFGQVPINGPRIIDAMQDGSNSQPGPPTIVWPENIVTGQTLVFAFTVDTGSTCSSVTDTLGNTYTLTSPTTTPAGGATKLLYMAYTLSGFSGANTITFTCTTGPQRIAGVRLANVGAVDGSVATGTITTAAATGTMSTTNTTTVNGDILISGSTTSGIFGNKFLAPGNNNYLSNQGGGNDDTIFLSYKNTGALGSQTDTVNWYQDYPTSSGGMAKQTLAFKPSTSILVADAVLPDAAVGASYSAQLHGMGGIAGLTYACTGLPANGLSLNTATGVISGATPTAGTLSLGCTVTDGSTTSATDTLTLAIKAGFNVPSIHLSDFSWSANNGGGGVVIAGVQCGSVMPIIARGADTHGGQGWIQSASGSGNKISDSFGSAVNLYQGPFPGMRAFPLETYILGPTATAGTDTITLVNNQTSSSARSSNAAFVLTGVQAGVDVGAQTNKVDLNGSSSMSVSYTTLVPNTLLLGMCTTDTGANAISMNSPFSASFTDSGAQDQGFTVYGSTLVASPSTVTLTCPYTVTAASAALSEMIIPLRPAAPFLACNNFVGAGEKFRRAGQ